MVDNKVNMSLDDIIKRERADKKKTVPMKRGGASKRGFSVRRNIRGGMRPSMGGANTAGPSNVRRNNAQRSSSKPVNRVATMKLVKKLVKKAITQRATQTLLQRAAVAQRRVAKRRLGTRVPFIRRRNKAAIAATRATRLYGRLRGVNRRSRIIVGSAARRARMQLQQQRQLQIVTPVARVRGRGVSRIGQLVSDSPAVVYERQVVAPQPTVQRRQIVRRINQPKIRQVPIQREVVIDQGPSRPVYVRPARGGYFRSIAATRGGVRKNTQRVIVVENSNAPVRRRRQFGLRRVIEMGEEPVQQYVQRNTFATSANNMKSIRNAQLREALGISRGRRNEPDRFESSSSFLQRVPVRKGRGFRNDQRFI